jgi:transcriptional regulator with XRE-family HTH domain
MSWEQELGKSIKEARAKKGWTQQQLGVELGVHPNTIRAYEKGNSSPDFGDVRKIAAALQEDHFDIGEGVRVDFNPNGRPRLEPVPQQLQLLFDERNGVNVRIESAGQGIVIKKLSA